MSFGFVDLANRFQNVADRCQQLPFRPESFDLGFDRLQCHRGAGQVPIVCQRFHLVLDFDLCLVQLIDLFFELLRFGRRLFPTSLERSVGVEFGGDLLFSELSSDQHTNPLTQVAMFLFVAEIAFKLGGIFADRRFLFDSIASDKSLLSQFRSLDVVVGFVALFFQFPILLLENGAAIDQTSLLRQAYG